MLTRRFKKLDVDSDGVASASERASAHHKKGKATGDGSDFLMPDRSGWA